MSREEIMADTELASRHCEACEQGTPPLDEERATLLQGDIDPAWERDGIRMLRRRLRFGDFKDAFGFATRIALVAEEEGHHPDMEIGWGKVVVSLTTHSSGGLTPNDFIMAAKVDRLAVGTGLKEG
jgi:4a-hydroxytetrahydrobiopterin dehydratase